MSFGMATDFESVVQIKVIGVGGGGGNAVNRMVRSDISGVEFIAVNTDKHVLMKSQATHKIQIGEKVTKGQGAGARPEVGKRAAEESKELVNDVLKGTDMVFITAGMGGGTGTGAAPVIAEEAKKSGILTVGIVTKPFGFEGRHRMDQAEQGILELSKHVDSLVVIPNDRLQYISDEEITLANAFDAADDVLRQAVRSISEIIRSAGYINTDFADVCTVMRDAGMAHMGVGRAEGKNKAEVAAQNAISSPLLETTIDGAHGLLICLSGNPNDLTLDEMEIASSTITKAVHPDANIVFGLDFDDSMEDSVKVTIVATGFDETPEDIINEDAPLGLGLDDGFDDFQLPDFNAPRASAPVSQPVQAPVADSFEDTNSLFIEEDQGEEDAYYDEISAIFSNRN